MQTWKSLGVMSVALGTLGAVTCRWTGSVMGDEPKATTVSPEIARLIQKTESLDSGERVAAIRELGLKRERAQPVLLALRYCLIVFMQRRASVVF